MIAKRGTIFRGCVGAVGGRGGLPMNNPCSRRNKSRLWLFCLFVAFCCPVVKSQTYQNYKSYISKWEGCKNSVYLDSLGNKTVGIGHLLPPNAANRHFSNQEIAVFYNHDFFAAYHSCLRLYVNFNELPPQIKLVLVDLAFNLGYNKLRKFINFNNDIRSMDYYKGAQDLKDSRWYHQTGKRAADHYKVLLFCAGYLPM